MIAFILIFPLIAAGQNLDQSVASALENAPSIAQSKHLTEAAKWQLRADVGALTPSINFSTIDNTSRTRIIRRTIQNRNASITQPIFNMTLLPNIQQSNLALKNAQIDEESSKQSLILDICKTYLSALTASDTIILKQQNIDVIKLELKKIEIELQAGTKTKRDYQHANANLKSKEAELVQEKSTLRNHIIKLQTLTNNTFNTIGMLSKQPNAYLLPNKPKPIETNNLAKVQQAYNNALIQDKEYSKSIVGIAPTVNITLNHKRTFDSTELNTASLSLSLPLSAEKTLQSFNNRQLAKASYQQWRAQNQKTTIEQNELLTKYDDHAALLKARLEKLTEREHYLAIQKKSMENNIISVRKYLNSLDDRDESIIELNQTYYDAWVNHFTNLAMRHNLSMKAVNELSKQLSKKSQLPL